MKVLDWIATWLTRFYARTITSTGVALEETYVSHNEENRVFWVNAENWPMGGQYTIFGTILLNESKLNERSGEVVDYVFLHEVGHSKPPYLLNIASFAIRVPLAMLALIGVPLILLEWLIFVISIPTIDALIEVSLIYLLAILLILVPLIIVSWLDEGYAELFALSKLGESSYQECINQVRDESDNGRFKRIFRRLFYPKPSIVIRTADLLR